MYVFEWWLKLAIRYRNWQFIVFIRLIYVFICLNRWFLDTLKYVATNKISDVSQKLSISRALMKTRSWFLTADMPF